MEFLELQTKFKNFLKLFQALMTSPEDRARLLKEEANKSFAQHDYDNAIIKYTAAIQLTPNDHILYRFQTFFLSFFKIIFLFNTTEGNK